MTDDPPGTPARSRRFVLVIGGARSGKSSYAEALAQRAARGGSVLYVATASAADEEMRARIAAHQRSRPPDWTTIEAPLDPGAAIQRSQAAHNAAVVVVDCVTLLVSNAILAGDTTSDGVPVDATAADKRAHDAVRELLAAYRAGSASYIVVTNEVGMGLVPPYPLGRLYRDTLGRLNADLAQEADAVILVVAGLPVEVKALARAWDTEARHLFGQDGSA